MEMLKTVFSYSFATRALIVGVLVSLCAALLGVSLVLKRYSMLGDGLSHVAFGSAAIALALGVAPLKISIPVVIIAAFLMLRTGGKIKGDAATAIVSSSALAIGVIVATMTTGMNTDISNYMFGSILAMSREDVFITAAAASVIIIIYIVFYNKIFASAFDESFASATGVHIGLYNSLLAVLTAVVVVIGMRMMGALLISSVMIFPALSAMRVCKRYKSVILMSALISVSAFIIGMLMSFLYDMPAGASIVVVNLVIFLIFSAISKTSA